MLAVQVARFGLGNLTLANTPRPVPGPDEVLLRVRAASLNYRDLLVAEGKYNPSYPLPLTLGSDAVAEVVELGPNTDAALSRGDRVCPIFAQGFLDGAPTRDTVRRTLGGPLPGVFAEFVLARGDSVVRVPDALSDLEAACLPCAGVTAYNALCEKGRLGASDTLLTLGSGGVSSFAIQIAKALGARVIATSRSPEKSAILRELGADQVITIDGPGWGKRARELAGGDGVDHVLDVGGAGTLAESLAAVRPGGTVSLVGVLADGSGEPVNLVPVTMREIRVQGIFVGHRRAFEALVEFVTRHALEPHVDSTFPLDRAAEAFERLRSGTHAGKICFEMAKPA